MLFSTMCWLFCYSFLITLDTTVHHISNAIYVKHLYKRVCLSATFGSRFIILIYKYEHLKEEIMSLDPLITEI